MKKNHGRDILKKHISLGLVLSIGWHPKPRYQKRTEKMGSEHLSLSLPSSCLQTATIPAASLNHHPHTGREMFRPLPAYRLRQLMIRHNRNMFDSLCYCLFWQQNLLCILLSKKIEHKNIRLNSIIRSVAWDHLSLLYSLCRCKQQKLSFRFLTLFELHWDKKWCLVCRDVKR